MHKAKAGGEWGANGEFYEGGKFVADSPDWQKRLGSRPKHGAKIEIEPYKWYAVSDREQTISLYEMLRFRCQWCCDYPNRRMQYPYPAYDTPFTRELLENYRFGIRTMTLREYCELAQKHNDTTECRIFNGRTQRCIDILRELENGSGN